MVIDPIRVTVAEAEVEVAMEIVEAAVEVETDVEEAVEIAEVEDVVIFKEDVAVIVRMTGTVVRKWSPLKVFR
ncbi:MAG: hypothetical protein ACSHYF_13720 [Verrucomicrobiaceae bacterium]